MRTSDKILIAISELPLAYSITIHGYLERHREESWFSRNLPRIYEFFNCLGATYVKLDRLERAGLIWAEPSEEAYRERGNRPRLYYQLTLAGEMRVLKLRE